MSETSKRKRTDDTDQGPEAGVSRTEDFWLNGRDIVIRTTSPGTPRTQTLYKVRTFIISLHCAVFATVFESGPQDAFNVGSERYDGLPVRDLPDADEDVKNYLKALCYPE